MSNTAEPIQTTDGIVGYDESTETFHAHCDPETEVPSQVIVETIATITECDPAELPVLHTVVNPDALNALFQPTVSGTSRDHGSVAFEYADHHVSLYSDGTIAVRSATTV